MIQWIKGWMLTRWRISMLQHKYEECHRAAESILALGFMNGTHAQERLTAARDALYSASAQFKRDIKELQKDSE